MASPAHMKPNEGGVELGSLPVVPTVPNAAEVPEIQPLETIEPLNSPADDEQLASAEALHTLEPKSSVAAEQAAMPMASVFDAPEAAAQPARKGGKGKVALALLALLGAAYAAGVVYFMGHFMPHTYALAPAPAGKSEKNYEDLAFKAVSDYEAEIAARCSNYSTTVTKGEYSLTVKGSDVELTPNDSALITNVEQLKGNPFLWPIQAIGMRRADEPVAAGFNEDKLAELVNESVSTWNETAKKPGPPSVVYNDKEGKFEAVHGTFGTQLEADPIREIVAGKLAEATSVEPLDTMTYPSEDDKAGDTSAEQNSATDEGAEGTDAAAEDAAAEDAQPTVADAEDHPDAGTDLDKLPATEMDDTVLTAPETAEDISHLEELADYGNKMINLKIPVHVNGQEGYVIKGNEILSWLVLDGDTFRVDEGRMDVWVDDILSPAINYTDDKYEWHTATNLNTKQIADRVLNLSEDPVDAIMFTMLRVPDETPGAKDRGRHIDVNIHTQYARMYNDKGEIIWETFIVTGEADGTHNTPTGTFQIQAKETNRVLIGLDEDKDGEPDYKTPVTYWMPFSGGYGLHDATWRSSFGGDIYSYGGSHGCVNLPYAKAESLFGIVNVGDTVYIHS